MIILELGFRGGERRTSEMNIGMHVVEVSMARKAPLEGRDPPDPKMESTLKLFISHRFWLSCAKVIYCPGSPIPKKNSQDLLILTDNSSVGNDHVPISLIPPPPLSPN